MEEKRLDRVLLAEDYDDLRLEYKLSLEKERFEVTEAEDGGLLLAQLRLKPLNYFDIIVSDTDMPVLCGPSAVSLAFRYGLLDPNKTSIMAMSDLEDNQAYWPGLCHHGCFYNKARLSERRIGAVVRQCLKNHRDLPEWRVLMIERE